MGRWSRWVRVVALVLAVSGPGAGCGESVPDPVTPVAPRIERPIVDLEAQNLPAAEEIAAMLAGEGSGVASDVQRIAVPPLAVAGSLDPWLGSAAGELVAARLSNTAGASVLARGELGQLVV